MQNTFEHIVELPKRNQSLIGYGHRGLITVAVYPRLHYAVHAPLESSAVGHAMPCFDAGAHARAAVIGGLHRDAKTGEVSETTPVCAKARGVG